MPNQRQLRTMFRCALASGLRVEMVQTLSAESAGIYRASDVIRKAQGGDGVPAALSVVRSWYLRYVEFRQTLRDPALGQDNFMIAAK